MTTKTTSKKMEILLVEDDSFDALMTKKFLNREKLDYNLTTLQDGDQALEYLNAEGIYKDSPRPDLVLLDMGLPKVDGSHVLEEIKKNAHLKNLPVIVLTGQSLDENPVSKFNLYEHSYVHKWLGMKDFISFVKAVQDSKQVPIPSKTKRIESK